MNPALAQLRPYPFERLRALLAGAKPPADLTHISLSIGEPRHAPPQFVLDALTANLAGYRQLPDDCGRAAAQSCRGRVADAAFPAACRAPSIPKRC